MSHRSRHPSNLPWYVAGSLDPSEHETVRAHLAGCGSCRAQAEQLMSLRSTLVRHRDTSHVSAGDLVAFARDELSDDVERREEVQRHLDTCQTCQEDLAAVSEELSTSTPVTRSDRRARASWARAAVLVAVLLAGAILWNLSRAPTETVTFLPPQRGGGSAIVIPGAGPWSFRIALPFEAPTGVYTLRIETQEGSPVAGLPERVVLKPDGTAVATIPSLPGPGQYRMVLTPPVQALGAPFEYSFQVVGESGTGTP